MLSNLFDLPVLQFLDPRRGIRWYLPHRVVGRLSELTYVSICSPANSVEWTYGEIEVIILSGILFVDYVICCRGFWEGG